MKGEVQLYLYDPEGGGIIEMVGQPSDTTSATVTYVPGTFTTVDSFYGDHVQQVARWLNQQDPNIVAFVWKEGTFPGEGTSPYGAGVLVDSPAATGLSEANDPRLAHAQAKLLADFEQEMRISDARLAGAEQIGMVTRGGSSRLPALRQPGFIMIRCTRWPAPECLRVGRPLPTRLTTTGATRTR